MGSGSTAPAPAPAAANSSQHHVQIPLPGPVNAKTNCWQGTLSFAEDAYQVRSLCMHSICAHCIPHCTVATCPSLTAARQLRRIHITASSFPCSNSQGGACTAIGVA